MSEALTRLSSRVAHVRRAILICFAMLAVVVAVLGYRVAREAAGLLSASRRLDHEAARWQQLSGAVARLPRAPVGSEPAERLTPEATFVALAEHVGRAAQRTGSTVRTLKRAQADTQDEKLSAPAGEPQVAGELELDTTYWSALDFLRALDSLPLPVTPMEIDLASASVGSRGKDARLVLRLKLLAYGMRSTEGK
jgi:hypothetical protein